MVATVGLKALSHCALSLRTTASMHVDVRRRARSVNTRITMNALDLAASTCVYATTCVDVRSEKAPLGGLKTSAI